MKDALQVEDLGDLVEDSVFLNQLQSGVSRWIKEIRKVRILTRIENVALFFMKVHLPK